MLFKHLCEFLHMTNRKSLVDELTKMYYMALDEQCRIKNEWKEKRLAEWSYYKMFWRIEGRLSVLRELIKLWE